MKLKNSKAFTIIELIDGKLKVDVGFEVDVSGTVDAVTGLVESAWDKVKWR